MNRQAIARRKPQQSRGREIVIGTLRKPLLLGTGWLCVGLGALGVVMPLFPTTPFLLVAVWAFSRSSPELAEKIRNHPVVGPFIRDWQDAGVIPTKAKVFAVVMMAAMFAYLHFGVRGAGLDRGRSGRGVAGRLGLHRDAAGPGAAVTGQSLPRRRSTGY